MKEYAFFENKLYLGLIESNIASGRTYQCKEGYISVFGCQNFCIHLVYQYENPSCYVPDAGLNF